MKRIDELNYLDSLDIDEIMSWNVNREIVDRYGERKSRKM